MPETNGTTPEAEPVADAVFDDDTVRGLNLDWPRGTRVAVVELVVEGEPTHFTGIVIGAYDETDTIVVEADPETKACVSSATAWEVMPVAILAPRLTDDRPGRGDTKSGHMVDLSGLPAPARWSELRRWGSSEARFHLWHDGCGVEP